MRPIDAVAQSDAAAQTWTTTYSHLFMWTPAMAAVITFLLRRRPLRALGFRLAKPRHYVVGYLVPLLVCGPVYLLTWASGLGRFSWAALSIAEERFGLPQGVAGALPLALLMVILAPAGMVATLGEELGWTGVLTPRLASVTSFARASLLRGLIWSVWHYPLVIVLLPRFRPGLPVPYALLCMTVSVTSISFVYTWLRLHSGSVWPAALLHAVSNQFQEAFEYLTENTGPTHYITFEFGAGFALILPLIALFFWRHERVAGLTAEPAT